jgi:hypothetical protein
MTGVVARVKTSSCSHRVQSIDQRKGTGRIAASHHTTPHHTTNAHTHPPTQRRGEGEASAHQGDQKHTPFLSLFFFSSSSVFFLCRASTHTPISPATPKDKTDSPPWRRYHRRSLRDSSAPAVAAPKRKGNVKKKTKRDKKHKP